MSDRTTPQIGRAQREKLLSILSDIKNFKSSVSIDDPDSMYVYGLCVRDLVEPFKILAAPLLSPDMASQLTAIEVEPSDFVSASNAMAKVTGLIPSVEDALERPATPVQREPDMSEGHCPQCGPTRRAQVVAAKEVNVTRYEPSGYDTTTVDVYRILQCQGCAKVYFQQESMFSEDWDVEFNPTTGKTEGGLKRYIAHWPPPQKMPIPQWVERLTDLDLVAVLHEIYGAHDAEYPTLVAIGVRTALDRTYVLKGADENVPFEKKLTSLLNKGVITKDELESLKELTDVGSAAAHRAWKPDADDLKKMIQNMEAFLYRVLVQRAEVRAIHASAPKRTKRTKESRS